MVGNILCFMVATLESSGDPFFFKAIFTFKSIFNQGMCFNFYFYWRVVGLQCCVSFRCKAKWLSYTHTHTHIYIYTYICESESCSVMSDSATPITIQSMEFSRPEYWSGLPFSSPGDLPNPGIKPRSPELQVDSLPAEPQGKPIRARTHTHTHTHTHTYIFFFRIFSHIGYYRI